MKIFVNHRPSDDPIAIVPHCESFCQAGILHSRCIVLVVLSDYWLEDETWMWLQINISRSVTFVKGDEMSVENINLWDMFMYIKASVKLKLFFRHWCTMYFWTSCRISTNHWRLNRWQSWSHGNQLLMNLKQSLMSWLRSATLSKIFQLCWRCYISVILSFSSFCLSK